MGKTSKHTRENLAAAVKAMLDYGVAVFVPKPSIMAARDNLFPWHVGNTRIHRNTMIALEKKGCVKITRQAATPVHAVLTDNARHKLEAAYGKAMVIQFD